MAALVFDIETVGEEWGNFDDVTQNTLTKWIDEGDKTATEKAGQREKLRSSLGLSPFTGSIVSLGLYDIERHQGAVYYVGPETKKDTYEKDFVLKACTEEELLNDFWEGARSYDTFVTFNGRTFDVPFILNRSLVHNIVPTRDLMNHRYLSQQADVRHVDILDQLTCYGAYFRRPSLHLVCRALNIDSPKTADVSGEHVATMFRNEEFQAIARYNTHDVIALTAIYERWYQTIAPEYFKILD